MSDIPGRLSLRTELARQTGLAQMHPWIKMTIKMTIKTAVKMVPGVKWLLRLAGRTPFPVPTGHYYSPIPSIPELRRREAAIWGPPPRELPGIDLHEAEQLVLSERLATEFYPELPAFGDQHSGDLRYVFGNDFYSYGDAIFLYGMMRHLRPRRIVEVGSGYSSCLMLDVNERFFDNAITCTFIEPHPERLFSLVRQEDLSRLRVIERCVQDVGIELFQELSVGDILFIDSTHVCKTGSDVNYLLFEVLPRLASGVHVHIHDVPYPFEYPTAWIFEGRWYNEAYAVRAFLAFNSAFEIVAWPHFLATHHHERLAQAMPLCLRNVGGSLWLRRN